MHGQSEPRAAATPSRAEEGSRREAKAQDNRGNAKTRNTKEQEGEVDSPGKAPAGAVSPAPARGMPGQLAQRQQSEPPLSPRVPNAVNNYIGPRAREAPLWWHADLCQDHEYMRSDENQKTTILGKILAKEIHEAPGKILAGDDCAPRQDPCRAPGKALAEDISRAAARPAPAKTPPPFPSSY